MTITDQVAEPVASLAAQALGLAFPDVPGFGGQGWSTHETMLAVKWLLADPAAWDQALGVAREYPGNPHAVADTLHEQIVPRPVLEAMAVQGLDPARVNWLEIAHELIERRDDPRPSPDGAVTMAGDDADVIPASGGAPVPDDPDAVAMYTAHRLDEAAQQLARATGHLQAARGASGDLRAYHSGHVTRHMGNALKAGHLLAANLREHYPAEGSELDKTTKTIGLARGYELNPRSGMISLDLPPGTIAPVPDGVSDHHITVVYLGPDVDDEAFAQACDRARSAAAAMPGPLTGTVGGVGTFPPSDGSDGKVPAWAGVVIPGTERIRSALEDLSASEHKDWKPHVTLAYVEPGEPLPAPVPQTPVTFTHLSVHRGDDEVARFPLGGGPAEMANPGAISLAKALSEDAKAATTAHLLQTILYDCGHASRHAQAMLDEPSPDDLWSFNADHAEKHLGGAVEHVAKLNEHLKDNYPEEAKWLGGLQKMQGQIADPETISGQAKRHAEIS